jgi:YcxB-like protein
MENSYEKVEVIGRIEELDMLRENRWYYYSKWYNKLLPVCSGMLILSFGWILFNSGFQLLSQIDVTLISTCFIILLPVIMPLTISFQTKKRFSNLKDFQRNIHYSFTADGFEMNDEKSSSQISWESIHKVIETKNSFNLFINKNWFHIVPKRLILSPDNLIVMRNILRKSLAEKASLEK